MRPEEEAKVLLDDRGPIGVTTTILEFDPGVKDFETIDEEESFALLAQSKLVWVPLQEA